MPRDFSQHSYGRNPMPRGAPELGRFFASRCRKGSCGPTYGFGLKSRLPIDWLTLWAGLRRGWAFLGTWPAEPRDLTRAGSGGKFVVSRSGEAYDVGARPPNRESWFNAAFSNCVLSSRIQITRTRSAGCVNPTVKASTHKLRHLRELVLITYRIEQMPNSTPVTNVA